MSNGTPATSLLKTTIEKKIGLGLQDVKYFTGDVSDSTVESFCKEINDLDQAIEAGNFEEVDWEDVD